MKTTALLLLVLLSTVGSASLAAAQAPNVAHDTWTNGAPMPTAVANAAVGVLNGQIYVVAGYNAEGSIIADTQIYNPSLDTWSTGVPLPTTLTGGSAAVVNNILFVMGGSVDGLTYSNAVWAFSSKTQTWSPKAAMPTALNDAAVAVENGIIYVIGGNSTQNVRARLVESYNPATDSWKYKAPLLVGRSEPTAGLVGNQSISFIVVADGYASGGDTEAYDATTNKWTTLKADPVPVPGAYGWRSLACSGSIGANLYVAGGYYGPPVFLSNLHESFNMPGNVWTTLAPMPQAAMATGSAVYGGRLYCLGGTLAYWAPGALNNVQIYQP